MAVQNSLYGKDLSELEASAAYLSTSVKGAPNGVASLDSNSRVPTSQVPAITTTVGFGGEVISVPYTDTNITLPISIQNGGTGVTNSASALSALGAQPTYPILGALHTTAGVGLVVKNDLGLISIRSLLANSPITLTNPTGGIGNPTISISQGPGSGLNADLVDGLHASSFLRVDGAITHSTGTASTIRTSILSASSGANTDITSLGTITRLGNTNSNHIQITSTGAIGIGDTPDSYGKAVIRGGAAGTANSSLALLAPDGVINSRANLALYSTFGTSADVNVRRTADIVAGFNNGVWGTEYLSLHVGGSADTRLVGTERMRIDGTGNVLVGKNTTTLSGGDVQISKGISFPAVQVPCSNVNTLDDYEEGTWTPFIQSSVPGTGRSTSVLSATYTKIGRVVTIHAYVQLSAIGTGGSGYTDILGLPFTTMNQYSAVQCSYFAGLKSPLICVSGTTTPNSTNLHFYAHSTLGINAELLDFATYVQQSSVFIFSATYFSI